MIKEISIVEIGIILIGILLIGILVIQFYANRKRKKLEEERNQLETILKSNSEQYQSVVDENKELKNIRHDLQKYVRISKELENGTLNEKITGNSIVDAILYQKSKEMKDKQIDFRLEACELGEIRIDKIEIIRLFTNLMDNAIEACERADGETWVSLFLSREQEKLIIKLQNTKSRFEHPLENHMKTVKTDREKHGYGISVIQDIVHKHQGEIQMLDEEDSFQVWVQMNANKSTLEVITGDS